jgi:outer membrane protein OmpA-like peptidoglycan-associated protein
MKFASILLILCGVLSAQASPAPNPISQSVVNQEGDSVPVYRITVVARTTKAINYHHRSGSTKVGFRGTALMPDARGEAKVESKQGVIKVDANMERLQPATQYGPEYLTYVMWAITPEGRAINIGELLLDDGKSKLNATVELQTFGLIVTAEPYFAVTQPSDVVVMENFVRHDTTGTIEEVDAKYELLQRGQYTLNVKPGYIRPVSLDPRVPLELYEARNAVQIARWTGAERYAPETFEKALIGLQNAEDYLRGKAGKKPIGTVAREAVQMAEDARIITVKRIEEERLANERSAAAEREARANDEARESARQAEEQARKREQADLDRDAAERATLAAERATREAERAKQEAQTAAEISARQRAEAEAAKAAAIEQQKAAQAEAEKAHMLVDAAERLRQNAENEKAELRAKLLNQLNLVLETKDSARGLIVNMSDVLFDTGKYTLRPGAREKLAKIAGIVLTQPGLKLEVEGHTDNVGGVEYNQRLSENRAAAVRDYLVQQGIPISSITAKGFGKTLPVVSNDTPAGRQQNRRVELVVSGEAIDSRISPSQ